MSSRANHIQLNVIQYVSYPKCNSGEVQEVDGKEPPSRL